MLPAMFLLRFGGLNHSQLTFASPDLWVFSLVTVRMPTLSRYIVTRVSAGGELGAGLGGAVGVPPAVDPPPAHPPRAGDQPPVRGAALSAGHAAAAPGPGSVLHTRVCT